MRDFSHEAKRLLRFEPASITAPESTMGTVDAVTTGRPDARAGMSNLLPGKLNQGDRVVIVGGGDNEAPTAIGLNPWVI